MEERLNEAFEFDEQLTVVGSRLRIGDRAPDFALDHFDPGLGTLGVVRLEDSAGQVRLLSVVNSLDTPVCHVETHRWQTMSAALPPGVRLYTISMDLPFAQARWHSAEAVSHQSLSCHRSEAFGQDYGVLLKEWRLLQRAVFVIDRHDRVAYVDYVADQMQEPNYGAALDMVRQIAAQA